MITTPRYILALGLALTLLVGMRAPLLRCEPFVAGTPQFFDEEDYIRGANAQASGDTSNDIAESWMRAPGTAWLILTTARWRGVLPQLAACDVQRVQIGLWALLLLLGAAITATLFGRRSALIVAMLLAILPVGIGVTVMVHADTLFAACFIATFWALLRYARRPRLPWLLLAVAGAGASALTRSLIMPLLPFLAAWVAVATWQNQEPTTENHPLTRQRRFSFLNAPFSILSLRVALAVAIFLGGTALILTPWTIRNYRLYGGFIPSDTTGAINLFDNNAPVRHTSHRAIRESSDNPAERQRFAMRQAWMVISADPARFARKFAYTAWLAWSPEAFHRTLNFFIVVLERPLVGSLLTQLTALTWLALPLALLGLLYAPAGTPAAQGYRAMAAVTMLLYTVLIGLTHFEERYRIPYLLLWLPYAGWCLGYPRALLGRLGWRSGQMAVGSPAKHRPARLRGVARLIPALLIVSGACSYAGLLWPTQWENAQALGLHARGLARAAWGDSAGALGDQTAAARRQPRLIEAHVAAARLQAAQGDVAGAEATLRVAIPAEDIGPSRPSPLATVALQQLLHAQGRADEVIALDRALSLAGRRQAEALAWGQGTPAAPTLQVGPAADFGRVEGFYPSEAAGEYRWSGAQARLLLAGTGDHACLRMTAARPPHIAAPHVGLSARRAGGGWVALGRLLPPRSGWGWFCAPLTLPGDGLLELRIDTGVFNPLTLGQTDARDLGVAVAAAELRAGPLALDAATGLLFDRPIVGGVPAPAFQLIGVDGAARGKPGATVPLTLWWRGAQPPAGAFTFVHVRDAGGQRRAAYNAPLAGERRPDPWSASEPLLDLVGIALPADLPPGTYRLVGGAFNPADGAQITQADLGEFVVEPGP